MDVLTSASSMMTQTCCMASLDIASSIYSLNFAQQHRKLQKFGWKNKLSNGLASGHTTHEYWNTLRNERCNSTACIDDIYLQRVYKISI